MSHDTPQPGSKTGWYEDEHGILRRDWDEDDEIQFLNYLDVFSDFDKPELIERYRLQKLFEDPDKLLNRMAGRIAKLAGEKHA